MSSWQHRWNSSFIPLLQLLQRLLLWVFMFYLTTLCSVLPECSGFDLGTGVGWIHYAKRLRFGLAWGYFGLNSDVGWIWFGVFGVGKMEHIRIQGELGSQEDNSVITSAGLKLNGRTHEKEQFVTLQR